MEYWIRNNSKHATANSRVQLSRALGDNVSRLRQEQELTKSSFSQMSGICRPLLNKIEDGTSDIRLSYVHKLADALCVEPSSLFLYQRNERQ